MRKEIPAPIISILSEHLPQLETHASLDNLFLYADAPGEPPEGSKPVKTQAWLRRINKESVEPILVLGKLIETYMEMTPSETFPWETSSQDPKIEFQELLRKQLLRSNLSYQDGGFVSDGSSISSKSLREIIKEKEIPSIEAEFNRALTNVNSEPREAVSAACNILESIFKVYIEDEKLVSPQKLDLQSVWKVVRADLGFDPASIEDNDLKKILSGILSVIDGIGSFRSHASSAHGQGRKIYNIKPRHARLAIHSAHTLAVFILETWEERKKK